MFAEMGLKSVRMEDIAVACGISKRTLYENFADRESLVRQSLDYYMSKNTEMMTGHLSSAKNAIDEFLILFKYGGEFRETNKKVSMDMSKFYPRVFDDFITRHNTELTINNRIRLKRGIEQGLFLENLDMGFMSIILTNYLYGLHRNVEVLTLSEFGNNNTVQASLQFAIMLFLRGITTEKGREYIDNNFLNEEINKQQNRLKQLG